MSPTAQHLQLLPHLLTAPDDTAAQVATGLGVDHGWGVLLALQVGEVDSPTLSFLPETGEQKRRKEGKKEGGSEKLLWHQTRRGPRSPCPPCLLSQTKGYLSASRNISRATS